MKIKRILLSVMLLLTLALSGCIPVILVAVGATAGGAIIYDKRSTATIMADVDIANRALAKINQDPQLKGKVRVEISVFNHLVLMVGQAQTEELKQRAYEDVSEVDQITRIYNQIEVSKILTFKDRSADSWITSKVKTAMLATKGLSSSQIKVVTENKVVYLMGIVSSKQAELATSAARKVTDVRKVVQVFEYET